jgi:hypothetical protein
MKRINTDRKEDSILQSYRCSSSPSVFIGGKIRPSVEAKWIAGQISISPAARARAIAGGEPLDEMHARVAARTSLPTKAGFHPATRVDLTFYG